MPDTPRPDEPVTPSCSSSSLVPASDPDCPPGQFDLTWLCREAQREFGPGLRIILQPSVDNGIFGLCVMNERGDGYQKKFSKDLLGAYQGRDLSRQVYKSLFHRSAPEL